MFRDASVRKQFCTFVMAAGLFSSCSSRSIPSTVGTAVGPDSQSAGQLAPSGTSSPAGLVPSVTTTIQEINQSLNSTASHALLSTDVAALQAEGLLLESDAADLALFSKN